MFYIILFIIIVIILVIIYGFKAKANSLDGKHVVITGGSKGIGFALASTAVESGANVTIIARDSEALEKAHMLLLKKCVRLPKQKVLCYSNDVSGEYCDLEKTIIEAESISGPVFVLVCCAGTSVSYRFEETPLNDFKRLMSINYIGTVNTIRASLASMKSTNGSHIVIVSSIAGLFGLYGYSAYAPTKFALIGLAQALAMELKAWNIKITLSLPPDTDTPGYAEENITKPLETKLISESGGLYSAEEVAKKTLDDALKGKFTSTIGFESWMVKTVCSGMMPIDSIVDLISQVLTMGVFRIAAFVFLKKCDSQIEKCAQDKQSNKKAL